MEKGGWLPSKVGLLCLRDGVGECRMDSRRTRKITVEGANERILCPDPCWESLLVGATLQAPVGRVEQSPCQSPSQEK